VVPNGYNSVPEHLQLFLICFRTLVIKKIHLRNWFFVGMFYLSTDNKFTKLCLEFSVNYNNYKHHLKV